MQISIFQSGLVRHNCLKLRAVLLFIPVTATSSPWERDMLFLVLFILVGSARKEDFEMTANEKNRNNDRKRVEERAEGEQCGMLWKRKKYLDAFLKKIKKRNKEFECLISL